jgi:hypothetical protein
MGLVEGWRGFTGLVETLKLCSSVNELSMLLEEHQRTFLVRETIADFAVKKKAFSASLPSRCALVDLRG